MPRRNRRHVDARLAVDELRGLLRGHVAIGMVALPSFTELPTCWRPSTTSTRRGNHAYRGKLRSPTPRDPNRRTRPRVGRPIERPPAGIAIQLITDETLVAAVSRDHPLAQRESITLRASPRLSSSASLWAPGCGPASIKRAPPPAFGRTSYLRPATRDPRPARQPRTRRRHTAQGIR